MTSYKASSGKDTGYAWVIVFVGLCVNVIADGINFAFGMFLVEFVAAFGEGRGYTGTIGAVTVGAMHLIGPIAGLLSDKFGSRVVVMFGGILACVGMVTSYLATGVLYLCFSFGLVGGLGLGFMYIPTSICVMQYFDKRLALANGIAVCGSGLGTVIFAQIVPRLIAFYSWRGTMLILAGVQLNGVVLGLLLRPPPVTASHNLEKGELIADKDESSSNTYTEDQVLTHANTAELKHGGKYSAFENTESQHITSAGDTQMTNIELVTSENKLIANSGESETEQQHFVLKICMLFCNFDLLRDARFMVILSSCFIVQLAFYIPYTLLPDQVAQTGITLAQSSWLVSSIGICNTVSRVVLGWFSDRQCVNRTVLLVILLFLSGITTGLSPWLTSFEAKLVYTCLIGTFLGGFVMLIYTVLVDMFGRENISRSFGLLMFVIGVASLISTPFGGWLYDVTKSYSITFIVAGSEFIVGGLFVVLTKCLPSTYVSEDKGKQPQDGT